METTMKAQMATGKKMISGRRKCLGRKVKVKVKLLSRVRLFATPWTVAHQVPRSMGFSRQEYWSGVPLPSLVTDPNPSLKNQ